MTPIYRKDALAIAGLNIFLIVGIVSILLKIFKIVTWNWWIIFLPIWGPPALFFTILLVVFAFVEITAFFVWLGKFIFRSPK